MPSAATRPCVQCAAAASRYNCPQCRASTCSAPCSKAHKLRAHGSDAAAGPSSAAANGVPTGPRSMVVGAPTGPRSIVAGAPTAPRGMSAAAAQPALSVAKRRPRDGAELLQDLGLLEHIGAAVSELGRSAVRDGLYDAYEASLQTPDAARDAAAAKGGRAPRLTHGQMKRQTLSKQIGWKRLSVMLLPDGMQMRQENQTMWKNREQEFSFTVDLRFPHAPAEASGSVLAAKDAQAKEGKVSRILLHRVAGGRHVHSLFVEELRRRARKAADVPAPVKAPDTSAASKGKGKGKGKALKQEPAAAQSSAEEALFADGFPPAVLVSAGLDPDATASTSTAGATQLPSGAVVLLGIHAERLRNESTPKFLRWWEGQVRRGTVDAGSIETFEEQQAARAALEEQEQQRVPDEQQAQQMQQQAQWAQQQAMARGPPPGGYGGPPPGGYSGPPPGGYAGPPPPYYNGPPPGVPFGAASLYQEPAPAAPQHALSRLTSSSLLGSLGAKLRGPNAAPAPSAALPSPTPQAAQQASPAPSAPIAPAEPAKMRPPVEKASAAAPALRHFVAIRDAALGLEAMLSQLPAGFAVVEYAQLELWPQARVETAEKEGLIRVHELGESVEAQADKKREREATAAADEESSSKRTRVVKAEQECMPAPAASVPSVASQPAVSAPPIRSAPAQASSGLMGLAAYDSDSDAESDEEESPPAASSSRQLSPEQIRSRQIARSELLSAAPREPSSEPDEEDLEEEEARGSVADIARLLGIAPPAPVKLEQKASVVEPKSAPAAALASLEDEVDWGED